MDRQHPRIWRLASSDMGRAKLVALFTALAALVVPAASTVLAQGTRSDSRAELHLPPLDMQLTFSPWAKVCNTDANPGAKRVCVTVTDGTLENGEAPISVAIIEIDGEQKKLLRMRMPYGVALRHGTRLIVDQWQPVTAPFETCLPPIVQPGGCLSDYEVTIELISRMKSGQLLTVQAIHMNGRPITPQLELKGFAKVYEGPGTEPFAEQQKKLQDALRARGKYDTPQLHLRPKN
jgi:invasion protein IalB